MKDLIALVADKNMEFVIKGLLERHHSLKIRNISYDIEVHSHRDPGIYNTSHDFLRIFIDMYSHAIVMLDREGCGREKKSLQIANDIQIKLDNSGWSNRSKVIVIDPELEVWVWSESSEVGACIGWEDTELRNWLKKENYLNPEIQKPYNPKTVFEKALRIKGKPRSSSIYRKLAEKVSLDRCADSAFIDFKSTLKKWFPN